jgi:UDP-N-acetylmuramoylalanine--D-glutamate ligase
MTRMVTDAGPASTSAWPLRRGAGPGTPLGHRALAPVRGKNGGVTRISSKPRPPVPGGPYLVVGLARSGKAAAQLLARRGGEVIGCDAGSPEGVEAIRETGVEVHTEATGVELLDRVRCVIKSPGVPREAPVVLAALARPIPVLGELELAWRLMPNRFVGVTGTNGKTTVSELLGHLWRTAGEPVAVAGNVGMPLGSLVGAVDQEATVICECSSFQLEDAEAFAPECGVLLNIAPDHLDRHPTPRDYLEAKLRLFGNQGPEDASVYNESDVALRDVELPGRGRRIRFCLDGAKLRAGCRARVTDDAIELGGETLVRVDELSLRGVHNAGNAAAAAAVAEAAGIGRRAIAAALREFPGLAHRLERVGEVGGVTYINDSKATNVAAATAALRSFEAGRVRAILGGSPKGEGFAALSEPVSERCAACYLVGEAADALERELEPAWRRGVDRRRCDGIAAAVRAAAADARPGDVVLLAPACASFDAYRDFEQRGEHFRELVGELLED